MVGLWVDVKAGSLVEAMAAMKESVKELLMVHGLAAYLVYLRVAMREKCLVY